MSGFDVTRHYRNFRRSFLKLAAAVFTAALVLSPSLVVGVAPAQAIQPSEILRYEVTWNGRKAGHGDVTTFGGSGKVKVVVQAVSDGVLKAIMELWSRAQASFNPKTFRPRRYRFQLKSSLLKSEWVDLTFNHKTGLVKVNKQKGDERDSHSEKFEASYDPVTAAYLLRSQEDFSKPMFVDIYDGKARARLFVTPGGSETVKVKCGFYPAIRLNLRLVRLTGEKKEIATGCLWISNDRHHIPLLLTSSPVVGTVKFELVQVQRPKSL
ncbi:MAG: DUF3108 domain-containing protein [Deltaproteobacteria bacterium]